MQHNIMKFQETMIKIIGVREGMSVRKVMDTVFWDAKGFWDYSLILWNMVQPSFLQSTAKL